MAEWAVDKHHPKHNENDVGLGAAAVSEGARHQGWRGHCEHALAGQAWDVIDEDLALADQCLIHAHVHGEDVDAQVPEEATRRGPGSREWHRPCAVSPRGKPNRAQGVGRPHCKQHDSLGEGTTAPTRDVRIGVEILADIRVTLHNRTECSVSGAACLLCRRSSAGKAPPGSGSARC